MWLTEGSSLGAIRVDVRIIAGHIPATTYDIYIGGVCRYRSSIRIDEFVIN
jgi:hypothetical protein